MMTNDELIQIEKCLNIYKGQFEEGGVMGRIIMNAFDGKYEQGHLFIHDEEHEIIF